MLRQAAVVLLLCVLATEANRCKYRESRRPQALEIRPRLCRGAGSFIGEDYWTSIGYDGQIRDGRSRSDFLTFDQTTTGYVAYWITRTKYGNTHYEAFGHAFVRPDGRICGWFVGLNREIVEVCGGFRVLSRNRYNPSEPIPFEWVQVNDYITPKNTLGFHQHRVAKYTGPNESFYGDARLQERNFQGVSPLTESFTEVTSPAEFERLVWLLRRKQDAPEPSNIRGGGYIPDPQERFEDPRFANVDDVRGDPRLSDPRFISWLQQYDPRFANASPDLWRYVMGGRPSYSSAPQPVRESNAPAVGDGWQVVGDGASPEGQGGQGLADAGARGPQPVGGAVDAYGRPISGGAGQHRIGQGAHPSVDAYGRPIGQGVQPSSGSSSSGWQQVDAYGRPIGGGQLGDAQSAPVGEGARPAQAGSDVGSGVQPAGEAVGHGARPGVDAYGRPLEDGSQQGGRQAVALDAYGRPIGQAVKPLDSGAAGVIGQGSQPGTGQGRVDAYGRPIGQGAQLSDSGAPAIGSGAHPGGATDAHGRAIGQGAQPGGQGRVDAYARPIAEASTAGEGPRQPAVDAYGRPLSGYNRDIYGRLVDAYGRLIPGQGGSQTYARVRPPTILRDEFGTTYRQAVVDGHTYFYADPHVQGQQIQDRSDARLDAEQWRRQQEHMRRMEEERRAQEQRIREQWGRDPVGAPGVPQQVPQQQPRREEATRTEPRIEEPKREEEGKVDTDKVVEVPKGEELVDMTEKEPKTEIKEEEKPEEPVPFEKEEEPVEEETEVNKPEKLPPPKQTAEETEEEEEDDA